MEMGCLMNLNGVKDYYLTADPYKGNLKYKSLYDCTFKHI
jgi:hypothetical protein